MTRKLAFLLTCLAVSFLSCTTEKEKKDTRFDHLWRAGYGYNNPNPQREKDGQPPVNFDGSIHRD